MSAIATALYLGGWQLPFIDIEGLGITFPKGIIVLVHLGVFMIKTLFVVLVVM